MANLGGNTERNDIVGQILGDDRAGADDRSPSDAYARQHHASRSQPAIGADANGRKRLLLELLGNVSTAESVTGGNDRDAGGEHGGWSHLDASLPVDHASLADEGSFPEPDGAAMGIEEGALPDDGVPAEGDPRFFSPVGYDRRAGVDLAMRAETDTTGVNQPGTRMDECSLRKAGETEPKTCDQVLRQPDDFAPNQERNRLRSMEIDPFRIRHASRYSTAMRGPLTVRGA